MTTPSLNPTSQVLRPSTYTGELVIAGISMHTPAWNIIDLRFLWMPAAIRGSDTLIPTAAGVLPQPRRATVTQQSLPMIIAGFADAAGATVDETDYIEQLEVNMAYLRSNVIDPTYTGDGTRSATLTMPSGATRTAYIHVLGFTPAGFGPYHISGTLDISIPGGAFS